LGQVDKSLQGSQAMPGLNPAGRAFFDTKGGRAARFPAAS